MDQKQAYAVGIDFGTQSGRAVLVELGTAREMAASVWEYPHGVMDRTLRTGSGWGRIGRSSTGGLSAGAGKDSAGGNPAGRRIAGAGHWIGCCFTACTMLPPRQTAVLCA